MNIRPKIRNATLVGALAAVAATAWATTESMSNAIFVPAYSTAVEPSVATESDAVAVSESLSPSETVVATSDAVVKLTGYTITAGQAYRAGRDAGSVMGVKYVQNEIRPRIGGSV